MFDNGDRFRHGSRLLMVDRRVDWLPEERAHEAVQFQTVGILYAD